MRHIKSYANDNAIQEAVDSQALGKPYVALDENTGKIDWNGKTGAERRIIATYEYDGNLFNYGMADLPTPWFTKVEHNGQDVTDLVAPDGTYNGTWGSGPQTFYFSFEGSDLSMTDENGFGLFYENNGLSELVIPDHVTAIGNNFCNYCGTLQTVRLPEGLTVIPEGAFSGCSSLANFNIPASVTTIKSFAFASAGDVSLDITLPSTLQLIEKGAFYDAIFENLFIPSGISFQNGENESETTFGSDGQYPYEVVIENGRTTIPDWFMGNVGRINTIPASVTSIGHHAFICPEIYVDATNPPSISSDSFSNVENVYIPCETYNSYANTLWGNYNLVDPCPSGGTGSEEGWGEDEG